MERKTNKTDPRQVKPGHIMTTINWVVVKDVSKDGGVLLVDDINDPELTDIKIEGKDLIETCFSADLFAEEKKITRTEMAEILVTSYNRPFTVAFIKQDDAKAPTARRKAGEDLAVRVLRGMLISPEPLMGRSTVIDFDVEAEYKVRQVDHRTLQWLIVDGIKYVVKK